MRKLPIETLSKFENAVIAVVPLAILLAGEVVVTAGVEAVVEVERTVPPYTSNTCE